MMRMTRSASNWTRRSAHALLSSHPVHSKGIACILFQCLSLKLLSVTHFLGFFHTFWAKISPIRLHHLAEVVATSTCTVISEDSPQVILNIVFYCFGSTWRPYFLFLGLVSEAFLIMFYVQRLSHRPGSHCKLVASATVQCRLFKHAANKRILVMARVFHMQKQKTL